MAENTKIGWTENTVNFWIGCKKVSPGCKYCYMYRNLTFHQENPKNIHRCSDQNFYKALKWKEPKKVFTNSYSDFFLEEADAWRSDAWGVIESTPQHQWQILTKRPNLINRRLPKNWGEGWDHVILGTSIENQDYFFRAHELTLVPAKRRFLSIEPLIGEIDILSEVNGERPIDQIDWVILGGESGNEFGDYRYRPCEIKWLKKIVTDLKSEAPHVRVFVKQLGTFQSQKLNLKDRHGMDMNEWPMELDELRLHEFAPEIAELA